MVEQRIEDLVKQAKTAAQNQQLGEASDLLDRILNEDPNHLQALDLFGFVRFFQQQYAEAEQYCRRALALQPDHAYAHKGLGLCLARQGKLDEGIASLKRAMTLKPTWGDPYWDLGVIFVENRRYQDALDVLEQGQAKATGNHDFRTFMGQVQRKMVADKTRPQP